MQTSVQLRYNLFKRVYSEILLRNQEIYHIALFIYVLSEGTLSDVRLSPEISVSNCSTARLAADYVVWSVVIV